jgi:hypothetical protein
MKKYVRLILKPNIIILHLLDRFSFLFSDNFFLKIKFYLIFKKKLNLKNPQTFNEKLQWLKLYDRNPIYTYMVDKVEAKKHVASIIGKDYIIPTLGVYDKFEDINLEQLPNQFVLKTTHDSGGVILCNNKIDFDFKFAKKKITKHLKKNPYYFTREWPYKNLKPRIIVEKYLVDESRKELKDYKFFCFDGQVKFIQVDYNRFTNHTRNIYNLNWELQNFKIEYPNDKSHIIDAPKKLDKMILLANELSKNIPHLRVDLYYNNDEIFFGELTFFHGSGTEKFSPDIWDYTFGSFINIPISNFT